MKNKKFFTTENITPRGEVKVDIFLYESNEKISLSAFETKPLDTMGAGDTVLGIASMLLSLNAPLNIVAYLSNLFGAISTSIMGHSNSVKKKDILKSVEYGLK